MPIFVGNNKMRAFKGNYGPINIYEGGEKVAGWKSASQTGKSLHFDLTYNDTVELELTGETDQPKRFRTATGTSVVITNHASGDSLRMVEFVGNSEQSADKYREVSGTAVTIDPTLHDKTIADKLVVGGTTVQKSDYYAKDGLITQSSNYYAKDGLSSQYVDTKQTGKNMFNWETSLNKTVDDTGLIGDSTTRLLSDFISVSNVAYYCKTNNSVCRLIGYIEYDASKVFIQRVIFDLLEKGFTPSVNAKIIRLYFSHTTNSTVIDKSFLTTVQLELGAVATAFEPYKDTVKSGLVMELSGRNFFNDPATTTLQDRSGNGNVGTASGFQYRTTEYADRTADFTGKTVGNVTVNPHIGKHNNNLGSTTLLNPASFPYEFSSGSYSVNLSTLNGVSEVITDNHVGGIAEQLFSFNVLAEFEKAYGAVPSADQTTAGKVAWLKANLSQITVNWYGYGASPLGNKAYGKRWDALNSQWVQHTNVWNTSASPTLVIINPSISNDLDSNGFIHTMAHSDASDGVTASTIYTDYVKLDLKFKPASGSDGAGGIKYDGIDDLVVINKASFVPSVFTLETTFSLASLTSLQYILNLNEGDALGDNPIIYWSLSAQQLGYWYGTNNYISTPISINTTYHIAVTRTVTETKVYINGALVSTFADSRILPPTTKVRLGSTLNKFSGSIKGFKMYDRALSASEVYQNYMAGANLNVPSPSDASPVTSNLPAKTYKYTDGSDIYEFTLPEELRGIGTAVDKVVFDKVSKKAFVERRVGKELFDGSGGVTWGVTTSGFVNMAQAICTKLIPVVQGGATNILCSRFKSASGSDDFEHARFNAGSPSQFVIWIDRSKITSIDSAGFNSWLASNPTSVYYPLATVTSTPITFTKVTSSPYTEVPMTFLTTTPDPLHPADFYSNLPANTYRYTSTDGIYEFTLPEELRGIGTTVDKVVFDRVSHVGYLERRIGKLTLNGSETWLKNDVALPNNYLYYVWDLVPLQSSGSMKVARLQEQSVGYINSVDQNTLNQVGFSANAHASARYFNFGTAIGSSTINNLKSWLALNNVDVVYSKPVTRTPLVFTKVTSSTKTEVPMTFLTNTPSLDYPASVLSVESGSKVAIHGKNLINIANFTDSFCTHTISGNSLTVTGQYFGYVLVKVKPNTNYYIQADRSGDGAKAIRAYDTFLGKELTTGGYVSNKYFNSGPYDEISILFYGGMGTVATSTYTNIQLEEGAVATAYEPFKGYQETTIPVTLKSIG